MGWFRSAPGDGPADVRAAFVSVLRSHDRRAAGGGVLLSRSRLLTCAHVVNDALGRELLSTDHPAGAEIAVSFPEQAVPVRRLARPVLWMPPRRADGKAGPVPRGALEWAGDLAVLELSEPSPPGAAARPWTDMYEGQTVRAWHGGGQRATFVDVLVKACDSRIAYVDGALTGAAIGPGYSGGPLWSADQEATVGLVAAHIRPSAGPFSAQQVVRRSWCIPWQAVRAELERAGVKGLREAAGEPGNGEHGPGVADPRAHQFTEPLAALLGDPAVRTDHARRLAEQCGLGCPTDGSWPSIDELATVLAVHPRGLATLAESLAPQLTSPSGRAVLDELVLLGAASGTARLLSYGEYRRLVDRLAPLVRADPGLLPRAAADALKYHHLPPPLQSGRVTVETLDEAVCALEQLNDSAPVPLGTPRVPALLRLVEYVAVCVPGTDREGLHAWSGRVAKRLGIHDSALYERRADAVAWAGARRSSAARAVVSLSRWGADAEDRYACALWRGRPDGSAARVAAGEDRPRTPAEVAQVVRDTVHGLNPEQDDGVPLVEVVVDRDGLQIPVDEWNGMFPDEMMPRRLGEDFHVVLRCPELRRRSRSGEQDLARRWNARGTGEALVVDERITKEKLRQLLMKHLRCSRVVLHGGREQRAEMLTYSLAMGVPVVLWDREAIGHQDAGRLAAVDPEGPLDELPERVRCFRLDAYADPADLPTRPALVWEDADRRLPSELWLADPSERTEER
ncbi:trypsin-like peptidase domain-containing protein [Streptomyces sp. NPDC059373]